jgi:lipopolysaccharide transport system ATP-binding protein
LSSPVIKVENLSKLYRLGEIGTGTLRSDFQRWWAQMRGKEDPVSIVGHENDRSRKAEKDELIWALKDINFDVKQGEVLGIIGKNGAGKSTLLKILSQVTTPTKGEVKVKGRIASLLEVGTGFHPELTGRENIFLNGAILGMTKPEIRSRFDEIVEFAGVAKYIDTPVKRYSSGMYVRLAFAVAAHLEPEILIVDEVLAVGDAEFQKKALGKMESVSKNDGRTVLFVSHNMGAVKNLCNRAIILNNGMISFNGKTDDAIDLYLNAGLKGQFGIIPDNYPRNDWIKNKAYFRKAWVKNNQNETIETIKYLEPVILDCHIESFEVLEELTLIIMFGNSDCNMISYSASEHLNHPDTIKLKPGINTLKLKINQMLLPGKYFINLTLFNKEGFPLDGIYRFGEITVTSFAENGEQYPWARPLGMVRFNSELLESDSH